MTFIYRALISSVQAHRETANLCRRNAVENEAKGYRDLAQKWWEYHAEYIAKAKSCIKSARIERVNDVATLRTMQVAA